MRSVAKGLELAGSFDIVGGFSDEVLGGLKRAVRRSPRALFFDDNGRPRGGEGVKGLDSVISRNLARDGLAVTPEATPFSDCDFRIDLQLPENGTLVEIEKGRGPRLELDVLKVLSACIRYPDRYRYGALIVPASFITLKLATNQTPFAYLKRLVPLLKPVLEAPVVRRGRTAAAVEGFAVIGYDDPRATQP